MSALFSVSDLFVFFAKMQSYVKVFFDFIL